MPQSKIDSKCFNLTKKVNDFLSLSNVGRMDLTPQGFWKELASDEEAVSRFIVCLIAKLISLDSDNGLKNLSVVYRDLVEMPVDHSKYKHWSSKSLPANCRSSALELQYAIVTTIKHLKDCHGYTPNIHLRAMYLRWNLARNYSSDGATKADEFERNALSKGLPLHFSQRYFAIGCPLLLGEWQTAANSVSIKVIRNFSVAQAKEVIRSPLGSPLHKSPSRQTSSDEIDEHGVTQVLVEECYTNHKRASFGILPPGQCRLCSYSNAQDSLSYVRLRDMVSRHPSLLVTAIQHVLKLLQSEVSHTQDYGDREALLPLLHLFRELLTMNAPIDMISTYQTLMEFYMWPVAHAEFTQRVLDLILMEGRSKGTYFRRKLISEHELGIRPRSTKIRGQSVHMLVDTSHPLSRGTLLQDIFETHQEKPDQKALQRLIIRNVFRSTFGKFDVIQLEEKLLHLSSDSLKQYCLEAVELLERQAGDSAGEERGLQVSSELEKLHKAIVQCAESDEQRDSAVSCSSHENDGRLTEDCLASFSLPTPLIPSSSLDNTQYPTVLAKLREILICCQQKSSPRLSRGNIEGIGGGGREIREMMSSSPPGATTKAISMRTFSSSSHTSIDSTGSANLERDHHEAVAKGNGVCNGKMGNGHVEDHMTNGGDIQKGAIDHMTNGREEKAGHMTNGDHIETDCIDHITSNGNIKRRPSSVPDADTAFPDICATSPPLGNGSFSPDHVSGEDIPSSPSPPPAVPPDKKLLVRRMTCPSGMINKRNSLLTSSVGGISPIARRYANTSHQLAGRTMSISGGTGGGVSPIGGGRVKIRANPSAAISIKRKQRKSSVAVLSPTQKTNLKLVKVVLAGNDILVSHAARAYCHLRCEEPNLLNGLDVRFYYVPLSRASLIHSLNSESAPPTSSSSPSATPPDLPEPLFEQIDTSGNDVHIGRFLSHMDSWYERNVVIATHHLLRLVPCDISGSQSDETDHSDQPESLENHRPTPGKTSLTPAKMLLEVVSNYVREAGNTVKMKMFKVKMSLKSEKSIKIEHRNVYMLHRLDIQRLSGKKQSNRQVKTFEANLTMTELALDDSLLRNDMMEMKDVWSIRASNMPRAGDSSVPNPESEAVELTVIKALTEGGRFGATKHRLQEELQYHIYDLILETREKPFTVMVDGDPDVLIENVIRLELSPAHLDTGITPLQQMSMRRTDARLDRQLYFPLMTFWPIDL